MTIESIHEWTEEDRGEWKRIYAALVALMSTRGTNDAFGEGDYWVVDDDYGNRELSIIVNNLGLISQELIGAIQSELADFEKWVVRVGVVSLAPGTEWPEMEIVITRDQITDKLKREFLPQEFSSKSFVIK